MREPLKCETGNRYRFSRFFIFEFNTNNHSVRRIYGYLSKVQLLYGMVCYMIGHMVMPSLCVDNLVQFKFVKQT